MPNSPHILFISSWYPNRSNPTHGIFNRYFAEAAALYNRVSVIHVSSEENLKEEFDIRESEFQGVSIIHVYYRKIQENWPLLSKLLKRQRYLQAFDMAYQLLLKKGTPPSLIHLNVVLPAGLGALHLAKKHGLPMVVNENWSGYCEADGNYKSLTQKLMTSKILGAAKVIMPTSHFLKEAMMKHGLKGDYRVVPNVVNVHRFTPSQRVADNTIQLLHISSLTDREKNVSGLLRAFAKAVKQLPSLRLTVVGDGPERADHERLMQQLGLANTVHFSGRLIDEALTAALRDCDALVMFSHFETFCLVIVEAFATGKPVITSAAGAIPSYMQPQLGILVPPGDENALAQAMIDFAGTRATFNSDVIRRFAVEHFSYEQVGSQLSNIYAEVLHLPPYTTKT